MPSSVHASYSSPTVPRPPSSGPDTYARLGRSKMFLSASAAPAAASAPPATWVTGRPATVGAGSFAGSFETTAALLAETSAISLATVLPWDLSTGAARSATESAPGRLGPASERAATATGRTRRADRAVGDVRIPGDPPSSACRALSTCMALAVVALPHDGEFEKRMHELMEQMDPEMDRLRQELHVAG